MRLRLLVLFLFSCFISFICVAQPDTSAGAQSESIEARAAKGDPRAQNLMGEMSLREKNYAEALRWIKPSAEKGFSDAQVNLAFMYAMGYGIKKDLERSLHYYKLAAAQGHRDGEYNVGFFYLHGEGVEMDLPLARKWFLAAISHGDTDRSSNAVGLTFEKQGNYAEAFTWYKKSAELDYSDALYNVCRLTALRLGTPADFKEAYKSCFRLASMGNEWGQYGMGEIYKDGIGVEADYKQAASWYELAAEQGHPPSQMLLAELYAEGKGVPRDPVKAYLWAAAAGSGKNPEAQAFLEHLTANMTPEQITAGQALVRKWILDHPRDPDKDHIIYKKY